MEVKMKFYFAAGWFYGAAIVLMLMAIPWGVVPFVPLSIISILVGALCFFVSMFLAYREYFK